jgi:phage gp29-like protein
MVLYDQYGREMETSERKKPKSNTLAVAPIADAYREYVADGLTPERLAAIFRMADGGDMRSQAELFEMLEERDGHVPPTLPVIFKWRTL